MMQDVSDQFNLDEHQRIFRAEGGCLVKIHTLQQPHEPSRPTERCFRITASLCGSDGKALIAPSGKPYIRAPHLLILDLAHESDPGELFANEWAAQVGHIEELAAHLKATGQIDLPEVNVAKNKLSIPGVGLISGMDAIGPTETKH